MDIIFYTKVYDLPEVIQEGKKLGLIKSGSTTINKNPQSITFRLLDEIGIGTELQTNRVFFRIMARPDEPLGQYTFQESDFWGLEHCYDTDTDYFKKLLQIGIPFGFCEEHLLGQPYKRWNFKDFNGYCTYVSASNFKIQDLGFDFFGNPHESILTSIDYELRVIINVLNIDDALLHYSLLGYKQEDEIYSTGNSTLLKLKHEQFKKFTLLLSQNIRYDHDKVLFYEKNIDFEIRPRTQDDFERLRDEYLKREIIDLGQISEANDADYLMEKRFRFLSLESIVFSIISPNSCQFD